MAVGGDFGSHPLLILYGSQTGNAQDVAERIAREGSRRHYLTRTMSMNMLDPMALPKEKMILFVASTTGQGDPPDNMKTFWKSLLRKSLTATWLSGVQFAVFGLGDSGYQKYNAVAKKLDRRLVCLGARRAIPKGLGDDQHRSGYEAALDPWLAALWPALRQTAPLSPGLVDPTPGMDSMRMLDPPKFTVTYCAPIEAEEWRRYAESRHRGREHSACAEASSRWESSQAARNMVDIAEAKAMGLRAANGSVGLASSFAHQGEQTYGPKRPYIARMVKNERMTAENHFQDVRHIELDLGDSGMTYAPGDLLNILPSPSDRVIDEFLARCALDPEALVWIDAAGAVFASTNGLGSEFRQGLEMCLDDGESGNAGRANGLAKLSDVSPVSVRALVAAVMDVASAPPRRYFFEVLAHFAEEEREAEKLRFFASAQGRDDLYDYNNRERRTVLEVLNDFPSARMPLEWLLQTVPRLQPRAFSISSSLRRHRHQIHATVAVVNWKTPFNRIRRGLCSNWLASLNPTAEDEVYVPMWISQGALKNPPPSVPLILVGPGTGCAPFRAFIEDRAMLCEAETVDSSSSAVAGATHQGEGGGVVAPAHFFFGCRNEKGDFLYQEEWAWHCSGTGVLSEERGGGFTVAFSRDQASKVYVQHRIREQKVSLWRLLEEGGWVYVAGSASKMPAAVAAAFQDVAVEAGGMTKPQAEKWLQDMERVGRYHVEAWS